MLILIRRWLDDINDPDSTMVVCNSNTTHGLPICNGWAAEASRHGADDDAVILFSKSEHLYSHNTSLTIKEINTILKSDTIISLHEDEETMFLYLK